MDFQTYKREIRELNNSFVDYNSLEKWSGLLKELKKDVRNKRDKCQFMECVCEFVEFLANFVSQLNDLREETFVSRKSFNIIKELVNPNLEKVFLNCCIHTILVNIIEENMKNWCMKRELLQLLLNFIEKTDANNIKKIANRLEHHLIFKLVDQIGSCGNYPSQLLILKTIFYIYGKDEVDSKLNDLLPESQELSQGLADITLKTFHEDSRRFLNTFNERENNTQIFSIYCQNVQMEDRLIERFESWIDFNIRKEIISWYCLKNQLISSENVDDKFVLITFFISDISKLCHQLENTEYVVWFTLKAPFITDDEQVEEVIKNWKRVLFAFKVTDKSTYFIDNVLPKISKMEKEGFSPEAVSRQTVSQQISSPFISTSPTTHRSDIGSSLTTYSTTADFLNDGLLSAEKDISQIKMLNQRMEEIGITERITNFVYQRNSNPIDSAKNSSEVACFKLKDNCDLSEKVQYSAVLESKGSDYGSAEKNQIGEEMVVEEVEKSCNDKQSESSYASTSVLSYNDFLATNESEVESELITSDLSSDGFTKNEEGNGNDQHSEENLPETIHKDFTEQYDNDYYLYLRSSSKTTSSLQLLDELDAIFDASTQEIQNISSTEYEIDQNEMNSSKELKEENIKNRDSPTNKSEKGSQNYPSEPKNNKLKPSDDLIRKKNKKGKIAMDMVAKHEEEAQQIIDLTEEENITNEDLPTNESEKGGQNYHSETKNNKLKPSDDSIRKKNKKGKIAMDMVVEHEEITQQIIDLTISDDETSLGSEKFEKSSKKKLERLSKDESYVREQNDNETNKCKEKLSKHFSANQNKAESLSEVQNNKLQPAGDLKKNETVINLLVESKETAQQTIDLTSDEISLDNKQLEIQHKHVINTKVSEDILNNEDSAVQTGVKRNEPEKDRNTLDRSKKFGPGNDEQIQFEYKNNLNKEKSDNAKETVPTDSSELDLVTFDEENLQTDNCTKFNDAEILCSEIQEERLNNVQEINQTFKQVTVLETEGNNEMDITANDIEMSTNDNGNIRIVECEEASELISNKLQCQDVEKDASINKYDNDTSLTRKIKHERDVEEESPIITNLLKRRKNDLIAENKETAEIIDLTSHDEISSDVNQLELPHEHIIHTKKKRPIRKRRRSSIEDVIKSPGRKKRLRKSKGREKFEEMVEEEDETGKKNVNDEQDLISEINSSIQIEKKREGNSQFDNIKVNKIGNDENLKNPTIKNDKKRQVRKKIFVEEPDKIYYESDHVSQEDSIIAHKENCKSLANVAENKSKNNESLSCETEEQMKNKKTKLSNFDEIICESELNQLQHDSLVKDSLILDSELMLKNDGKSKETSEKLTSDLQVLNNEITDKTKKINIISVINLKARNTGENGIESRDENLKSLSATEANAEDIETMEFLECQNQSNHPINIDHSKKEIETGEKESLEKSDVRSKDSFGGNVICENQTNICDVTNEVTKAIVTSENAVPKRRRLYHPDHFLEAYPKHTVVTPKSKIITISDSRSAVESKKTLKQIEKVSMNKSKYSKNNIMETSCLKKQHKLEQENSKCLKYLKEIKTEKINLKIRQILDDFRKSVKEEVTKTTKAKNSKRNISLFIERRKEFEERDYIKNKTY